MEEDNQEISGWNDQNLQILDDRCFKFTKKKINQPTQLEQTKMSRRLVASRTLPVIKNMRSSLIKQNTDCKQKEQTTIIVDGVIESVGKKMISPQRVTQIEESKKQKNHYIRHNKRGHQHHQTLVMNIQHYLAVEDNDSYQKHQPISKHQQTMNKNQELSNISKLKIQVSQYSQNTKHLKNQDNQRSKQVQVKLGKNYQRDVIDKKYNSKQFAVKKEIASLVEGQQQGISQKEKIQSRQSFEEGIAESPIRELKQNPVLKQQYKNMANTIQFRKKNQYRIFNPKYNGLSKLANQKKKKYKTGQISSPSQQQQSRAGNNLTADFAKHRGCWLSTSSQPFLKSRSNNKQNQFYSIRLGNQLSLKTMPSNQVVKHQNLIDDVNQQLGFIFVRKQQNTHAAVDNLVNTGDKEIVVKNGKQSNKMSKIPSRKDRIKISSQPTVLDEFNDEYIFAHK